MHATSNIYSKPLRATLFNRERKEFSPRRDHFVCEVAEERKLIARSRHNHQSKDERIMTDQATKSLQLYLRPQRLMTQGGQVITEFFSLINMSELIIPNDSLQTTLVLKYEFCCASVTLPGTEIIEQWKELSIFFERVKVVYFFVFKRVGSPLQHPIPNAFDKVSFQVVEKESSGWKVVSSPLPQLSPSLNFDSHFFRSMCDCSRKSSYIV